MKKSISLVLCLAMLISVFSCLGLTASAAGVAKELFAVKESGFKNDKITYTVYLRKGVNLSGAIIYAKFDADVLAIDKANSGAYMVDDGDGGERENISGLYEADFMAGYDNQFSIAHAYGNDMDFKNSTSNKPYIQFTFKAIDGNRPSTKVKFYCYEFNSASIPENNITNGSSSLIYSYEGTTLSQAVISSVSSEKSGVRINWKKVIGADFYRVYRVENGENKLIKSTIDGDELTYLDKNVENNKVYKYVVRAVNEASSDGFAAPCSSAVSTRYTVAPSKLTLSNADGKVVVSWSAVTGATGYRVYRRTIGADGTVYDWNYLSGKITERKYSDKSAKSGKTYEYAVRVYSKGGSSDLYSQKKIVYLDAPEFTASATTKGIKLSWDKVDGASFYRIYRKTGSGSWSRIASVTDATSYLDKGASSGKKVYYLIKAVKGDYISDYEKHSVNYLKTPEVSVKNITTGVNVSWEKVSGATSYAVYRKAGSAKSWTKIKTTTGASYTDKTTKSGTSYKYCVRAISSSAKSEFGGSSYKTIRFLAAPELKKIISTEYGVTVYWGEVKGATKYIIYRKSGSGSYKELETVTGNDTVKYRDNTAKKGVTYSYKVYAGYGSSISSYNSSLSIKDKY